MQYKNGDKSAHQILPDVILEVESQNIIPSTKQKRFSMDKHEL